MVVSRRTVLGIAAVASALVFLASPPAAAATVAGNVVSASVVWISGVAPRVPVQEMRNVNKTFLPELVVVPVGGTVRFPNDDPFFHSIYSGSDVDPFDIGFYETGPGKDVTFDRVGILDVRCHIHALMRGTIVVVDGPYLNVDGAFSFEGVRSGMATISAWNVATGLRSVRVRVGKRDTLVRLAHDL